MALHDYASSRQNNVSHNIVIELGLDRSSQLIFTKLAKCYAAFVTPHDSKTRREQLNFLRSKLSPQLFKYVLNESDRLEKMTDLQRLQVLTAELPKMDHLAKFQIQDIENICKTLIDMDNKISLSEYCMILIVRVHIAKIGRSEAVEYSEQNDTIAMLSVPIAQLLSMTTTIVFAQKPESAMRCYNDIVEFLNIDIPYNDDLCWQTVFDETLPLMRGLSIGAQSRLEEVFLQLGKLPKLNLEGQCILFILQRAFNFLY